MSTQPTYDQLINLKNPANLKIIQEDPFSENEQSFVICHNKTQPQRLIYQN